MSGDVLQKNVCLGYVVIFLGPRFRPFSPLYCSTAHHSDHTWDHHRRAQADYRLFKLPSHTLGQFHSSVHHLSIMVGTSS